MNYNLTVLDAGQMLSRGVGFVKTGLEIIQIDLGVARTGMYFGESKALFIARNFG